MDLKWLKTFTIVIEEGSFRLAAEKLFISQPTVTLHIKALEQELNIILFERNHTKITVTVVGKHYYPMACQLLKEIEDHKKTIQDFAAIPQKETIVIALSAALASTSILSILHRFTLKRRNYKLELLMLDQHDEAELLQSKKADIVIDLNPTKQKDSHAEKLISAPLKLIYSPNLPMAGETRDARLHHLFTNNELAIGYLNEHIPVLKWLENEYPIQLFTAIKDSIFAIHLVQDQLVLGLLPEFLVERELMTNELNALSIGDITDFYEVSIFASYNRTQQNIQSFLHDLRNSLR